MECIVSLGELEVWSLAWRVESVGMKSELWSVKGKVCSEECVAWNAKCKVWLERGF